MGTNYYLHDISATPEPCPHCKRPYEQATPLHIGKSSAGWCFTLHVIPERGINTLEDWRKEWGKQGVEIRDEYERFVSVAEMEGVIRHRSWKRDGVPYGYPSWDVFHAQNHSVPGPHGLLRHAVGSFCVAHGEGTWDYVEGEFS